jgi:two-component system phosphate regulon sensor histidine kinase PhoR
VALSLRTRLFLVQGLIALVASGAFVGFAWRELRGWARTHTRESLLRTANVVERELGKPPGATGRDLDALADALGAELGSRITLIARDGRVLGDSHVAADSLAGLENHAARPEVVAALAGRTGEALRLSRSTGAEQYYLAIPSRAPPVAVVRASEPLRAVAEIGGSLFRLVALGVLVAVVLAVAVLYWYTGRQAARILELEAATAGLGADDPQARAAEHPEDELGRLGRAINRMAAERRARFEALVRERDMRELILAHMTDGIALVDGAGRVLHVNHSLAALVGEPRPAAPGTPFHEFLRVSEIDDLLQQARRDGRTVESDVRLWSPAQRLVRATATPLGSHADAAVLLVVHDLSEIERANRVRQDFVANVSHELRTPLTSIRGYAETLLEGGFDDLTHREDFARVIRDQASRLEAVAEDLLTLAGLERPDARLRLEDFDLRAMAAAQVAAFRMAAEREGLELALEPGPDVMVRGDRMRLEQVVANLLDNAIKYTERGAVTVRLGAEGDEAWCEIADTGSGIPPEDQPRIFERFYRVDKARSREKGGTGLGLAIVKHIVSLHGGEVGVSSEAARGSVFRFRLPRDAGVPGADG